MLTVPITPNICTKLMLRASLIESLVLEWTTSLDSSSGSLFVRMCIVQMSRSRRT